MVIASNKTDVNSTNEFWYNNATQFGSIAINLGSGEICQDCPGFDSNIALNDVFVLEQKPTSYLIELYELLVSPNQVNTTDEKELAKVCENSNFTAK
mmetsp:Transcript_11312/g.9702  ORF Transcript_11312/g.9702 Transcript_11312/m.9702 type:complete len:97 (-) Transcript_11312:770-1060(-)